VRVLRRLRVAYFSTGNEILSLGEPLREGAVYDSNRYTVRGLLQRLGCEVVDLGVVRDEPAACSKQAFREAAGKADAVITSGGVSVGEADFTKAMMKQLGDVAFWKIAMRPGRPMAVGRIGPSILFGLPGNPVAVMVTFLAFVRPALLRMMGCRDTAPPPLLRAHSQEPMRKKPGRTEYQRGIVSTAPTARCRCAPPATRARACSAPWCRPTASSCCTTRRATWRAGDGVDVMVFEGCI
jgi:molybdopterin molybdotransferase